MNNASYFFPTATRSQNIDLTGFSLRQNQTNTVSFRLYGYAAEAAGGTWRLNSPNASSGVIVLGDIDPIVTTSTPEPSSLLGFITLGGLMLGGIARKARK